MQPMQEGNQWPALPEFENYLEPTPEPWKTPKTPSPEVIWGELPSTPLFPGLLGEALHQNSTLLR